MITTRGRVWDRFDRLGGRSSFEESHGSSNKWKAGVGSADGPTHALGPPQRSDDPVFNCSCPTTHRSGGTRCGLTGSINFSENLRSLASSGVCIFLSLFFLLMNLHIDLFMQKMLGGPLFARACVIEMPACLYERCWNAPERQ